MTGRGDAPKGFDHIHRILGRALREVDRTLWPPRPHLGGPMPVLSTAHQVHVGFVIADAARRLAPPPDLAAFEVLVQLALGAADHTYKELDRPSAGKKSDHVGIKVAKLVVRAALNDLHAAPSARNTTGTCLENAAAALVVHVAPDQPEGVRAFLVELDDALVRQELAAHLADRAITPTSPLSRVISRHAAPGRKSLGLVIAKLADGRHGLYVKLKQKWEWHEGDRKTVFATVPDAFMELVIADLDQSSSRVTAR